MNMQNQLQQQRLQYSNKTPNNPNLIIPSTNLNFPQSNNNNQNLLNFPSNINNSNYKESNFKILTQETKINELETKLIVMEQNNNYLLEQIKNNSRSFDMQVAKFQQISESEKNNRERVEKLLMLFSDQSNSNINELKLKVNYLQEFFEKEEKWTYEQRQKDFETYKNILNTVTEKITETVKVEVDMRFKADIENKTFTQNIAQRIIGDIEGLKAEISELSKENKDLNHLTSKECSERSVNLSKYIDQMISKSLEDPSKNFEKLKNSLGKLHDEYMNNLTFQNDFNRIVENKLSAISDNSIKFFEKKAGEISDVEKKTEKKFHDLIIYIDNIFKFNNSNINDRIDNLSNNTDKNLKFLMTQIIDTRKKILHKINENKENSQNEFYSIVDDLQNILNKVENYETILIEFDKMNIKQKKDINKTLAEFQSKYETKFINEKISREMENEDIKDLIAKTNNDIIELGEITNNQLEGFTKNFEKETNEIEHKFNLISDRIDETNKNNYEIFENLENNLQKIVYDNEQKDLENLMCNMLDRIENEIKFEFLENNFSNKTENLEENYNKDIEKFEVLIAEEIDILKNSLKNGLDSVYERFDNDVDKRFLENENNLGTLRNLYEEINEKNLRDIEEKEKEMIEKEKEKEKEKEIEIEKEKVEKEKINQSNQSQDLNINVNESRKYLTNELVTVVEVDEIKLDVKNLMEKFISFEEKIQAENIEIKKKFEDVEENLKGKKNNPTEEEISAKQKYKVDLAAQMSLDNTINKAEFENIYNLLDKKENSDENDIKEKIKEEINKINEEIRECKEIVKTGEENVNKIKADYLEIMESKVSKIFEKIRFENKSMWKDAVKQMDQYNDMGGNYLII
jgi:hypothetical protein